MYMYTAHVNHNALYMYTHSVHVLRIVRYLHVLSTCTMRYKTHP